VALFALALALGCARDPGKPPVAALDAEGDAVSDAPTETLPEAGTEDDGGPFYDPEPNPTAILRPDAPSMRYAKLDQANCEAELKRRAVAFVRGEPTAGVLAPVRLRGPLHGVTIHSALPAAQIAKSPLELFDCRLVLALDDFAVLAAKRDIVEMIHMSAYRSRAAGGCTPKYVGQQHCAALAVDVGTFKKRDGSVLSVEKDFAGHVGSVTCGAASHPPATPSGRELWGLICDAADHALFHVILTPNFNAQHFNHVHLEITAKAEWMLIH
jgi:hypothetical protein